MQSVQMKERLSNVLAWFGSRISVIALTDLLSGHCGTLLNTIAFIYERRHVAPSASLGFEIVGNNTFKEFFP